MANFPVWYVLSWLPRLLSPSLAGDRAGLLAMAGRMPGPAPARTVRLAFLGDLSGVINRRPPAVDAVLRDRIAAADLVVANCESPVVERPHAPLLTRLSLRHAMTACFLTEALAACGVARARLVLSLANNHALDQGVAGLDETVKALRGAGIALAGLTDEAPPVREVGGILVSFDAFTIWRNASADLFEPRIAMAPRPAPRPAADLACVLPHWDREFRHVPSALTRQAARRLAENGAGLIVGGHQHVPQPIEIAGETLVAYGLGDFLGTAWRRIRWPLRIAAMLEVDVSADAATRGRVAGWTLIPFYRLPDRDRERLVPVERLGGALRERVGARVGAIFATRPPAASP